MTAQHPKTAVFFLTGKYIIINLENYTGIIYIPVMSARIFISYGEEDYGTAKRLYDDLKASGFNPWMDKEDILAGQNQKLEIRQAIQESSYFLVLLSEKSLSDRGYFHKELKTALEILEQMPPSEIFILPVRLDACKPPYENLQDIQHTDLFPSYNDGLKQIVHAFKFQSDAVDGLKMKAKKVKLIFLHDYLLPDNFTGRIEERKRIKEIIQGNRDPVSEKYASLISVCAIGGMGKSCLIRKVVDDYNEHGRFKYIVWFSFYDARTEDEIYFFRGILNELGISDFNIQEEKTGFDELQKIRKNLCRRLHQIPILFVLDGLEVIQYTEDHKSSRFGYIKETYSEISKLLKHICNQNFSSAIITTRVSLSEFLDVAGFIEISLDAFEPEASIDYLMSLGLKGNEYELLNCVNLIGGHPLCLKAVGKYLQIKHIKPAQIKLVTGDPNIFRRSTEGERINKIMSAYRKELTEDQEYFLKMFSLHPRSVSEINFSIMVKNYTSSSDQISNRNYLWVLENIIDPLKQKGLIDEINDNDGNTSYSTHPLIKLAFLDWLENFEKRRGHDIWAKAAQVSPDYLKIAQATCLEDIQLYLDVIKHYLEADNIKEAWSVYRGNEIDHTLNLLGYAYHNLEIGKRFELGFDDNKWEASNIDLIWLYDHLGDSYNKVSQHEKTLAYREKEFSSAKSDGNNAWVLHTCSIYSRSLLSMGLVFKANKLLGEVESLYKFENNYYTKWFYQRVRLMESLYKGDYEKVIVDGDMMVAGHIDDYNMIGCDQHIIEALIRLKRFDEAERLLTDTEKKADMLHLNSLKPVILKNYILFNVNKNNVSAARCYNDKRIVIKRALELPYEDDGFLLIMECKYDEAIKQAQKHVSNLIKENINIKDEITNLLILANAWYIKDERKEAEKYFNKATKLINQNGCLREKDRWGYTRNLFI